MSRILTVLVVLSTTASLAGHGQLQPSHSQQIRPDERLLVASLLLRSVTVEEALRSEYARLADACGPEGTERSPACRVRNARTVRHRLAALYTGPSRSAPLLGFVHGVHFVFSSPDERYYGQLGLRLDIELVGTPGRFQNWISDLGDYGYHLDGDVRRAGEWVQLVGKGAPSNAWLPLVSEHLEVHVDGLEGGIVDLQPLSAVAPDGSPTVIEPGSYLITRVGSYWVEFRAEIETDFPCGEDVTPPAVMPPLFRAAPVEFFNRDGTPRFFTTYGKGC